MMCTVLGENGMEDLAYDFLFYEGFPGWLRCVNLGATTIWERWTPFWMTAASAVPR